MFSNLKRRWRALRGPAEVPASEMPPSIGKFAVRELIGAGEMGAVYLGHDPAFDRLVAIKTLRANATHAADAALRFRYEARAAGKLNHRNIVSVYEFGEDKGIEFLVMEYIVGHDLSAYLRAGHRFSVPHVLCIMSQLLDALHHAHEAGIVHRDIKPSNLLISHDGRLKIMDFGIAQMADSSQITRDGVWIGTPGYMAPERFTREPVDRRADIFSVGVLLHQLLTGHKPFLGTDESITFQIVYGPHRPLTEGSDDLALADFQPLVDRALAKKPQDRYPSALALSDALEALAARTQRVVPSLLPKSSLMIAALQSTEASTVLDDKRPAAPPMPTEEFQVQVRRRLGWGGYVGLRRFLEQSWIYNEADLHALLFDESRCLIVDEQGRAPDAVRVRRVVSTTEERLFRELDAAGVQRYLELNPETGRFTATASESTRLAGRAQGFDLRTHRFAAALAFAESTRLYVKRVAAELDLTLASTGYFYDSNFIEKLAMPAADAVLEDIFSNRAGLLVVFVDSDEPNSDWSGLALPTIKRIVEQRAPATVLFVGLDEQAVPDQFGAHPFLSAREMDPRDIARRICERMATLL
jgi:serine/threonine protein kinase